MSYNSPFTGNVIQPTDVSYRAVTLSANTQLEWPINGNATDDYAARIMNVTATAGGLSLYMPPANQASVGQDALIRNVGATTFTVKDYEGTNTIVTIAAGESKYIYITANPTATGTWSNIAFGTGTSSADAGTLAGSQPTGLVAEGAVLNQAHPIESLTNSYTFTSTDRALTYVWTGGAGSVTLPSANTLNNNWFTLIKNNGTGTLTVNTTGGQLFDGGTSKAFQPSESAFIVCSGTNFVTVGYGVSTQFEYGVLTKDVSAGGTITLTASEAANTIMIFTGTLASSVTVIVPPVVNFYIASNQTTALGNTLTMSTGAVGASTATIPANAQASLFCDATNILNANTTQAGGTTFGIVDGDASNPSLYFSLETNTGIFRPGGGGAFGISILGTQRFDLSATGLTITGDITATANVNAVDGVFTGDVDGVNAAFTGTGNFQGGISGGTF